MKVLFWSFLRYFQVYLLHSYGAFSLNPKAQEKPLKYFQNYCLKILHSNFISKAYFLLVAVIDIAFFNFQLTQLITLLTFV